MNYSCIGSAEDPASTVTYDDGNRLYKSETFVLYICPQAKTDEFTEAIYGRRDQPSSVGQLHKQAHQNKINRFSQ